jgi:SAM-dependent methyltransferase
MLGLLEGADTSLTLDVGSGTGHFTAQLAQTAARVVAIEPSHASMELARRNCVARDNVEFVEAPIEEASSVLRGVRATAATACMTLMTVPNVASFADALSGMLLSGAKFVATFCHPWFWPKYWGYDEEPWFEYGKEAFVEAPFIISRCRTEMRTTHVHRPLGHYVSVFASCGFRLDAIVEPMPSHEIHELYPQPWRFPRFIGLRWVRI